MKCLILLLCLSQEGFINRPDPVSPFDVAPPRQIIEPAGVSVTLDQPETATLAATAALDKMPLRIYSPTWCQWCKAMRAEWKSEGHEFGTDECPVEWIESEAWYQAQGYPLIHDQESGKVTWGKMPFSQVVNWRDQWRGAVVQSQPPITGSVRNISQYIDQYRSYVAGSTIQFREQTIDLGSVTLSLNSADCTLSESGESIVAKFGSRKPSVRWGYVELDVYGARTDGKSVTVEVPGPDWTLKVE